ncbi:hypothetical protein H3H36_22550 [Duganella sp. FT3S]|uniref:Uncharacterized protein n=1 Tax=Rugamonas fusca TaxID=2758568 RepID=A0A7W2I920_9BURK|nr:hypothetical protein [Rugamonas fusca]MBA5608134.1 hypothetical protein [Rugamonas fusca]
MVEMRKLLQFKKILSLAEAAQNLSTFVNQSMTVGDILNFGLEGSLQLSVNFLSPTKVRVGDRLPDDIGGDEGIKLCSPVVHRPPQGGHYTRVAPVVLLSLKIMDGKC